MATSKKASTLPAINVQETADSDQVGHHRNYVKGGGLAARDQPHHCGDQEACGNRPKERLDPARLEDMSADVDHYVAQLGRKNRRQCTKHCGCGCPGHIGGEDDCPQPSQLRQIGRREIGGEGQYRSDGVFRKELLACQDDDQKSDRVPKAGEQRPP
ncbi:MAG: hypothetical protein WA709_24820 [Stellaceae bacterium]